MLQHMRKSLGVTAVVFALVLAQANAWADEILVSAAASLTDALNTISKGYQSKSKNTVRFNFGPSSGLSRQIQEGAPADIFFSADVPQMDALDKKNLLEPGTRKDLLSNQLVIIVPADSKLPITSPRDLLNSDIKRIALAEPASVPVGVYTREYLTNEGLWDQVKGRLAITQDVRATLASVESGNVEAGFVYKTDAAVSNKVRIVYEVPLDKGPKIIYPVAIVKESKQKNTARDFLSYLVTPGSKELFKKYGFIVLD